MKTYGKWLIIIAAVLFLFTPESVYAWDPITHYHLNKESGEASGMRYPGVFYESGPGPDMFLYSGTGADEAHSPVPKINRIANWRIEPNFAYIMLRTRGYGHPESRYYASAMGWGGHIAADWVAHNNTEGHKLFPIGAPGHTRGEYLCDYYMWLTRGGIPLEFRMYPQQIWKAFVNYELVRIHRVDSRKPDDLLMSEAIDQTPIMLEVWSRIKLLEGTTAALQDRYTALELSARAQGLAIGDEYYYLNEFKTRMRQENVEDNFGLSEYVINL